MKKIITLLATFTLLGGCSGNCGNKHANSHEEKLHNKGIAIESHAPRHIESHAPRHISGVTSEAARRASSATLKH